MENLSDEFWSCTLTTFDALTKKPEIYLSVQDNKALQIRKLLKNVYDFTKSAEESTADNQALQTLIINDFDEEQIWQQLELQNDSKWPQFITSIAKLHSNKNNLLFHTNNDGSDNVDAFDNTHNEEDDDKLSMHTSEADSSIDENNSDINYNFSDNSDDDGSQTDKKEKVLRKKLKPSIVDDKFFKLGEMENFLIEEDRKAMNEGLPNINNDSDDDDDASDGSIDFFDDIDSANLSDEDEENDQNDEEDRQKYPRYEDFFDYPQDEIKPNKVRNKINDINGSDSENSDESADNKHEAEKRVRFHLTQNESDVNSDDSDANDEDDEQPPTTLDKDNNVKSAFEIRQERLKKKIGHLEKAALDERPWQLKGEIDASNRPQNSLLEEVLEFDLTSRPAPVITQETTLKLEDIIRRRVKDKAFDDVERKVKPVDTHLEYKKELVLNQEKSKESLAQIYEQEYLKQKAALNPESSEQTEEEPKEHIEIKGMMNSLFAQLDALSNFHYTPRPAAPEIKIVSNVPVICMEEVAPVSTSEATLLAPQEIQKKTKGDVIGKAERTETDKKRERRQKKLMQRNKEQKQQQKDKLLNKLNPGLGNKYSKEKASKLIDKLAKDRNIEKMDISGSKSTKSSQAFFTQLQEEIQGQIKSKIQSGKSKDKNKVTAKKIKL